MYSEILKTISGEPVTDWRVWESFRRVEILTLFEHFVYGEAPSGRPRDLSFHAKSREREEGILQKTVTVSFTGYSFKVNVFLPKCVEKPLPAYLVILHEFAEKTTDVSSALDFENLPIAEIVKHGYAVITMPTSGIVREFFLNEKYMQGVFPVLDTWRTTAAWSILAAWAWGASRVMDYIESDSDLDSKRVAVIGHSRGGKAALWAAAQDKRFAMCVSNCSGCGGAAITRDKRGEHIKDIIHTNWFCENYSRYVDNEAMLPVDQHMLLALLAPRLLYVASAAEDTWADPQSELLACKLASEVYEKIYNKQGVVCDEAAENVAYHAGRIGYHMKTGKHSLTKFDWRMFLDFSDKHMQ